MAANKKKATARHTEDTPVKSFLDMIAPSVVQFNPDHFICGNTFRCVWALREYPTQTDEQALLRHLGEKDGITLRIYTRQLTPAEEDRILHNAANKNRMNKSNPNDLRQTIIAETNLQDMISMEGSRHRNKEPLFHCAVYIELTAPDYDALKLLQTDVLTELVRSKLNVDRLLLRQQQGFCCASPVGYNAFGAQFERVLPANSVANLYPFNYSGKTDAKGFYVGRDKYGSNILVDFDQRDEDKTSAILAVREKNYRVFTDFIVNTGKTLGLSDDAQRLAIVTMLIDDTVSAAVRIHLGYIQKDAVSEDDIFYSAFSLLLRKIDPLIGISGAANLTPAEGSPR